MGRVAADTLVEVSNLITLTDLRRLASVGRTELMPDVLHVDMQGVPRTTFNR
jgi:hypothetical protein